ncbi:MFS transporter [Paenibacillus sp. KACC 21273]|uniref:MFS transporter n=1 Tax=Paenibacillus sp. KACC 21273 TaxID=3025665 RepID=UPI0023660A42|nr:MFS transporter [Paenibacillus sp. KACC 21273]WDF51632.1 MFS transporter [Paenibacillus sp. KACC 21273]
MTFNPHSSKYSKWKNHIHFWKYPSILLTGVAIANIGDWIFLIALNLTMLDMSGSPLAIAGLYILKPFATLCTNSWAGSVVDRLNKRRLMITFDLIRAVLIFTLPFLHHIGLIYAVVLVIYMASSIFRPTSMVYTTKLIPTEHRKRFNSIQSLIHSGAFLIGPAIAGLLFLITSPQMAIFVTAVAFGISSMMTWILPDLEKGTVAIDHPVNQEPITKMAKSNRSWQMIKHDWRLVIAFSRQAWNVMLIYFLFQILMVLAAGLDSMEVAFVKEVLAGTDSQYSYLVSVAGIGLGVGALVNMVIVKRLTVTILLAVGAIGFGAGYVIYSLSDSFTGAAIGFFVLAFFMAFMNTGFMTFYQNHVPIDMMGRISSIYSLVAAVMQMLSVFILGLTAQLWSISWSVIIGSCVMLGITLVLALAVRLYMPISPPEEAQ